MEPSDKVDILLATYNGEKHLSELLDSLLSQSHDNVSMLVRDDASSDATGDILERYAAAHPDKIIRIKDDLGNLGPMRNFEKIAEFSESDYIFFADQDDVWATNKVELCLEELKRQEEVSSQDTPCLVFSDMYITNDDLSIICPSYFAYCQKKPRKRKMKDLIFQNIMLGCVQGFNKALLQRAFPIEKDVIMHDWWLAIVASALGRVSYIEKPLIHYRQHSRNVIGARGPSLLTYKKMMPWADKSSYVQHFNLIFQQAAYFLERYEGLLSEEQKKTLGSFIGMQNKGFFGRLITMGGKGFFRNNLHETLEVLFRYSPR